MNLRHPAPKAGALPSCATSRNVTCLVYLLREWVSSPVKMDESKYADALLKSHQNQKKEIVQSRDWAIQNLPGLDAETQAQLMER